jgi:hypothetical protein
MSRPVRAALGAALVLAGAAGALVLAPAASAAPLPTPSVSKSTVAWNEHFTISGTGCVDPVDGTAGSVAVEGTEFGDGAMASPDGSWFIQGVYNNVPSGSYTFSATCHLSGGPQPYPAFGVTVNAPGSPPAPAPTPAPPPVVAPVPPPVTRPNLPRTPTGSPVPPPAPSVTARATANATPTAPAASAAPATAPASTAPVSAGPAAGCVDCTALAGGDPVEPGRALDLSWTGFRPGEQVTVVMRSTPVTLGTFTADAAGTVTAAVELPGEVEAGAHTLTFSGPVSGDLVVVPFTVAAAGPAAASATVPAAEAAPDEEELAPWLAGGLAALLLGAGGVALHRRRTAGRAQVTLTPIADPIR